MARVVIVDDAPFVREVLSHILKSAGYDIIGEAADGEEAVQVVLEKLPDIVIMDIVMPKKNGLLATKEILQQNPNIKIVACSTENSEAIITQSIEAGCLDFISKPFDQKGVIKTIQSALARKDSKKRKSS